MNAPTAILKTLRVAAALLLCCSPSIAQRFERPNADAGPTRLQISIGALDIEEINSKTQSFTMNLYFMARWQDDSLAHPGPGNAVIETDEAWFPNFQFTNQQKVIRTFPERLLVTPSGEVFYRQRVWGPFSQKLNLSEFPFDRHTFQVLLVAAVPTLSPGTIELVQDPEYTSGLAADFSLPDWSVEGWTATPTVYNPLARPEGTPGFAFEFVARRHVGYFMLKLMLPLMLIVMMSWIVFWIDPEDMGIQVSVAVTSMLTLIAYRFMVGASVPPGLLPDTPGQVHLLCNAAGVRHARRSGPDRDHDPQRPWRDRTPHRQVRACPVSRRAAGRDVRLPGGLTPLGRAPVARASSVLSSPTPAPRAGLRPRASRPRSAGATRSTAGGRAPREPRPGGPLGSVPARAPGSRTARPCGCA